MVIFPEMEPPVICPICPDVPSESVTMTRLPLPNVVNVPAFNFITPFTKRESDVLPMLTLLLIVKLPVLA